MFNILDILDILDTFWQDQPSFNEAELETYIDTMIHDMIMWMIFD